MSVLVYHNGECSKCKELTEILHSKALDIEYKFYLHEALSIEELADLIMKLGVGVADIIRKSEPLFVERFEGKEWSNDKWLQTIVDNPILLQRPIVMYNSKAVIARPPEKVLEIL